MERRGWAHNVLVVFLHRHLIMTTLEVKPTIRHLGKVTFLVVSNLAGVLWVVARVVTSMTAATVQQVGVIDFSLRRRDVEAELSQCTIE
jgi:hypothetical protein